MASAAPLPELRAGHRALVAERRFQELVGRSRSLTEKILSSIPDTHAACVRTETLRLNSPENTKLVIMAQNIGLPSAPALSVASEDFDPERSLRQMSEGLQLLRALLSSISPRLQNQTRLVELTADVKDLLIQVHKMLKMLLTDVAVKSPPPTPPALRLPGEYEVQVAAHLTLEQLQAFGRDVVRCLRSLDQSEDTDS